MYFNVFGERVSRTRYREMLAAAKNRREFIAAGLGRRDLLKMRRRLLDADQGLERAESPDGLELDLYRVA